MYVFIYLFIYLLFYFLFLVFFKWFHQEMLSHRLGTVNDFHEGYELLFIINPPILIGRLRRIPKVIWNVRW